MNDNFSMDYTKMEEAAAELKNRVSGMVTQSFAAAPAAAQAAAGANMNYMTGLALVAAFAQMASAIKTLTEEANEHSKLIETSAQAVKMDDAKRATKDFNVDTTFSYKRPGSTNA
ncbi:MAG TPA: hypothetical protein VFC19_53350 [Candidatus Limnocylindrales bacterium]|nr:hypothetical protein [Candidatus Limnocylindrales bacterium]